MTKVNLKLISKPQVPFPPVQLLNEKLGLNSLSLLSESESLSCGRSKPTCLCGSRRYVLPLGESVCGLVLPFLD